MLIPELIQRVLAGHLRFEFIEATVTAIEGSLLSSIKGKARAEASEGCFQFHFFPRGPLPPEWSATSGYLASRDNSGCLFSVSGVEKGSALWTASTGDLRQVFGSRGLTLTGRVDEWSRTDSRSVHSSFVRLVVPGRHAYPVTVRHAGGVGSGTASVSVRGMNITFHNHGDYSELTATAPAGGFSDEVCEPVVQAFAVVLGHPVQWVYREWHEDGQRTMSVRPASRTSTFLLSDTVNEMMCDQQFWNAYAHELEQRLPKKVIG